MESMIIEEVVERLSVMPVNLQRRVLDYVEALRASAVQGVPGRKLTQFAGAIPQEDLRAMQAAIESDCERIDPDAW